MDELDAVVARQLQAVLEAGGVRREDFAREMGNLGFRWTGNTVSQVINGRRGLSLLELAGVCQLLRLPVGEFIDDAGCQVELPGGMRVDVADIGGALQHGTSAWSAKAEASATIRAALADHMEASVKAAKRLGITPAEVDRAAIELWGCDLAGERDRRVTPAEGESARTLQARRGHVTRALVDELRAHLEGGSR